MLTKATIFTIMLNAMLAIFSKGQNITVMTYNLRFDNPQDSANAWPNRKANVIKLIQKTSPSILGVQEALQHQLTDITSQLPHYKYVGVGRDDGKSKGEFSALFYDTRHYTAVSSGTFWLSENPEVPGSKNWDAAITRVATWAKLVHKRKNDTLFVMNTHFDHIGKVAREQSAILLKKKISVLAGKLLVILTGDFNIEPTESPYSILTNGDTYNLSDAGKGSLQGTYCTFKVNGEPCRRIDYIFYGVGWKVKKYQVLTQNNGKYYPSDHLPVVAKLKH